MEDGKIPNPELGTPNPEPLARIRFKCQRTARTINIHAPAVIQRRGGRPPRDKENNNALDSVKHNLSVLLQQELLRLPFRWQNPAVTPRPSFRAISSCGLRACLRRAPGYRHDARSIFS